MTGLSARLKFPDALLRIPLEFCSGRVRSWLRLEKRRSFETSSLPALSTRESPGSHWDRTDIKMESKGIFLDLTGVGPNSPGCFSIFGGEWDSEINSVVVQLRASLLVPGR